MVGLLLGLQLAGGDTNAYAAEEATPGVGAAFGVSFGGLMSRTCDDGACDYGNVQVTAAVQSGISPITNEPGYQSGIYVSAQFTWVEWYEAVWAGPEPDACGTGVDGIKLTVYHFTEGACTGGVGPVFSKYDYAGGWHDTYAEAYSAANDLAVGTLCGEPSNLTAIFGSVMVQEKLAEMIPNIGDGANPVPTPPAGYCQFHGTIIYGVINEPACGIEGDCSQGSPFRVVESENAAGYVCPCPDVCPPEECPEGQHWVSEPDCECQDDNTTSPENPPPGPGSPGPAAPPPPPPPGGSPGGPEGPGGPGPGPGPGPGGPGGPSPGEGPEAPGPEPAPPGGPGAPQPGPGPEPIPEPENPEPEGPPAPPPAPEPGEGEGGGIIGDCGIPDGPCPTGEFGVRYNKGSGKIGMTYYLRGTYTAPGSIYDPAQEAGPENPISPGFVGSDWRVLHIEIPYADGINMCCYQQTWGVNLPESAVDWEVVNSWRKPGAPLWQKNLANVILQSTHLQFDGQNPTYSGEEYAPPISLELRPNAYDAPYGYGCGSFLFPGKGCSASESEVYQDAVSSAALNAMMTQINEVSDQLTTHAINQAIDGLAAYNGIIEQVGSALTFGLFDPIKGTADNFGQQMAEAIESADTGPSDFWTVRQWGWNESGESWDIREYFPGNSRSMVGPTMAGWIKSILGMIGYVWGAYVVSTWVLPRTILPGVAGVGGDNDD